MDDSISHKLNGDASVDDIYKYISNNIIIDNNCNITFKIKLNNKKYNGNHSQTQDLGRVIIKSSKFVVRLAQPCMMVYNIILSLKDNDFLFNVLNDERMKNIYLHTSTLYLYINNIHGSINDIINKFNNIEDLIISDIDNEDIIFNKTNILLSDEKISVMLNKLEIVSIRNPIYLPDNISNTFPSIKSLDIICRNDNEVAEISNKYCNTSINRLIITAIYCKIKTNNHILLDINGFMNINELIIRGKNYNIIVDFNTIKNINNIENMTIEGCTLRESDNINKLNSLKYLDLTNVLFEEPITMLNIELKNLSHLILHQPKKFSSLLDKCILNLPSVNYIEINSCLKCVPIFINCHTLLDLNIGGNIIEELPDVMFKQIPNLNILKCTNNKIKKISSSIRICKNLHTLYISNNELKILPPDLKSVVTLKCSTNPLLTINNVDFENLQTCEIKNTSISILELKMNYKLKNLQKIICNIDQIKYISPNIREYITD